ncbi:MAG: DUF3078 domain-containing protein [Bergeyella sp.]
MSRITALLLIFLTGIFYSQKKPYLSEIDSISQSRWNAVSIDMDSLNDPKFDKVSVTLRRDTVIVPKEVIITSVPEEIPVTPFSLIKNPEKTWFYYGQNNLVFNQSSFSNWISGGNNNIGIIGKVNYNIIYKHQKHYLENIIQLGYGLIAQEDQSARKTEDYINLMTNYGYELGGDYYLSSGIQFLSQFTPGYNYSETPDPEISDRVSRFLAPGYVNLGIGISYNPKENFQVIFRPVNGKFTFVTDPHLQLAGKFGLERDGQSMRAEIGAMLNIIYRLKIKKGINFDNQLNFFSNYLHHSERVDIAYAGNLNIRFNKFISTIVSLDMVYDHDQIARLQRKQTLSVGLSYNLGQSIEKDQRPSKEVKPFVTK